ncbi:MAG: RNA polymerase sporulation sigma factor SigK [Bacillales bacterium]|nr:RNA polymerase sporulation sigma factor SigK [Bacillales bacterium]
MFKKILKYLFKDFYIFTMAYSNNVFKDPLSKEEEDEAVRLCLLGNKEARAKLIEHNLRLVAHIVKKYDNKSYDVDDLISIGTIGLIKGIDSYSFKHGTRITTYCARCIENEILMYFRSNKKNDSNISLDDKIGFDKEGNEITILDVLKTPMPMFDEVLETKDNIKLLRKYFNTLTEREKEIIIRRYGLDMHDEQTQKEIAYDLNISRSYVSRIEKRAITKILREFLKNKKC